MTVTHFTDIFLRLSNCLNNDIAQSKKICDVTSTRPVNWTSEASESGEHILSADVIFCRVDYDVEMCCPQVETWDYQTQS